MTHFVLDKNPEQEHNNHLNEQLKIFEANSINFVMYSNPFLKTNFFFKITQATSIPTIYFDFDLMYSGYAISKTVSLPETLTLYQPTKENLLQTLKTIILKVSKEKTLVIIDSLNGFYGQLQENKDVGRLVNSYIMLILCVAKMSDSCIFLAEMVRKNDEGRWVLSITGRRALETQPMKRILLEQANSSMLVKLPDEDKGQNKSFQIPFKTDFR